MRIHRVLLCVVLIGGLAACGGDSAGGKDLAELAKMASPADSIAYQIRLMNDGKLDELKACFVEGQRDRITAEAMAEGKRQVGSMPMDELFAGTETMEVDGHPAVKIKMKNGRTLTTLVQIEGKWLPTTIWFR